jgi:hypothetical protein
MQVKNKTHLQTNRGSQLMCLIRSDMLSYLQRVKDNISESYPSNKKRN